MFKNNLKTALRFLRRNKMFTAINALGLALALAVSFVILLYVINEYSYDYCHKNRKRVYRVNNHYVDFHNTLSGTPYVLSSDLKEEFPQIEKAVSLGNIMSFQLRAKDEFMDVLGTVGTDSELFDIFTISLIGRLSHEPLLRDPDALAISEELALKLFPGHDPEGQEIVGRVNNTDRHPLRAGSAKQYASCFGNEVEKGCAGYTLCIFIH